MADSTIHPNKKFVIIIITIPSVAPDPADDQTAAGVFFFP
jgi:hypothetical protein